MRRLTITLLLLVLVSIFGLGVALDLIFERYNTVPEDDLAPIKSLVTGLAEVLDQTSNPVATLESWPDNLSYRTRIETTDYLSLPSPLSIRLEAGEPLLLESDEGVSVHYFLPSHQLVLSVDTPLVTDQKNRPVAVLFTILFYLGTLLLVLLWLRPLLSRLNLLRRTAQAFGTGELSSRVPDNGGSYIRDIENDFNGMADRIQQLINDNKLLTSAVSHDLRTPLARLRFGVDTLAESTDENARQQYHRRISNDLSEMENQVNSLLRYAQLDNVMNDVEKKPVSLRQLLHECTAQYYDSRIVIKTDHSALNKEDELSVTGAIEHLATVFNNLIQNACDHAKTKLLIVTTRNRHQIKIDFNDDGPGIPEHRRSEIIKPFQRGESNCSSGYGLGLAVAERIVKHHRGTLSVAESAHLGGACFTLSLAVAWQGVEKRDERRDE